jgi:hypothetical protein
MGRCGPSCVAKVAVVVAPQFNDNTGSRTISKYRNLVNRFQFYIGSNLVHHKCSSTFVMHYHIHDRLLYDGSSSSTLSLLHSLFPFSELIIIVFVI